MRKSFLLIANFICFYHLFGQLKNGQVAPQQLTLKQKPVNISKEVWLANQNRQIKQTLQTKSVTEYQTNTQPRSSKISFKNKRTKNPVNLKRNSYNGSPDTSIRKLFDANGLQEIAYTSFVTKDGNVLIGGASRDPALGFTWFGHLLKVNSKGDIIWAKQFNDSIDSYVDIQFIKELSDGSIFISGDYFNKPSSADSTPYPDMMISRLTSTGQIIWAKTYKSNLTTCNYVPVRITSIAEGVNNEILFGASLSNCPYPQYQVIGKISSQGKLLWDKSIKQWNNFEYLQGVFYAGGKVVVAGRSGGPQSGGDDVIDIHFTELNYSDGALLSTKAWKPDVPDTRPLAAFYKSFVMYAVSSEVLNNGNYLVYGKLFDSFDDFTARDSVDHFAVLEFNKNFDFIKGYTIHSPLLSRYYLNQIYANKDGKVSYSLYSGDGSSDSYQFFGVIENNEIVKQRKIFYSGNLYAGIKQLQFLPDGSNVFVQTVLTNNGYNTSIEFTKMHNSDTSDSVCTGIDTSFASISPIEYIPYTNFKIDSVSSDQMYETTNKIYSAVFNYNVNDICKQVALCDTIKIRGIDSLCSTSQVITYTAYRANTCGAKVKWTVDTTVVAAFNQINDTTLNLRFKKSFNGYLYAEFQASCGPVKDSLLIIVLQTGDSLDIGPDTTICPGNIIQLKAQAGYISYRWQDNSSLPTFNAASFGKYYVTTKDACGKIYSDTVFISNQSYIPFNAGSDTSKCNSDTIILSAPAGFINYSWSPDYNIAGSSSSIVKVYPAVDIIYTVKAEKTPGCFVFDTVKVRVNYSSPISLGADTSFCSNDSLVIFAGNGFNEYNWNTGSTSTGITVNSTGTYTVIAKASNGCYSKDTLVVQKIYDLPVINLGNDFSLCTGSEKRLDAGNFNSYSWQNGSQNQYFIASVKGIYWVNVIDKNNCSASDTIEVKAILPLPSNFLKTVDSLCQYDKMQLQAQGNYMNYNWSTGSFQNSIIVEQSGVYRLTVTDANGCIGSDTINIIQKNCLNGVYIPTAFTPNNDGTNDVFRAKVFGNVISFQLQIFNRFGQLIFSSPDPYKAWDGTYKGMPADVGTFVYHCSYQLQSKEPVLEKGTIVLIR